jgi:hypothetical protein
LGLAGRTRGSHECERYQDDDSGSGGGNDESGSCYHEKGADEQFRTVPFQPVHCAIHHGKHQGAALLAVQAVLVGVQAGAIAVVDMPCAPIFDVAEMCREPSLHAVTVAGNMLFIAVAWPTRSEHDGAARGVDAGGRVVLSQIDLCGTVPGVTDITIRHFLEDEHKIVEFLGLWGWACGAASTTSYQLQGEAHCEQSDQDSLR